MSYNNLSASKSLPKESNRVSDTTQQKKTPSSSTKPSQDNQQTLKCPRCNSPNTKFCYYNNYSLSQPRHFCKTCRRYWTRGGALRNVPVGGGCRKSKKAVKCSNSALSSSSSSRFFSVMDDPKFFNGLINSPAIDFQLSGGLSLNSLVNLNPSLADRSIYDNNSNSSNNNIQLTSSFGDQNSNINGGSGSSLMGFNNYSLTNSGLASTGGSSMDFNGNIASSIETLSSLNQDLHWKLQQQRMAMIFGHNQKEIINGADSSLEKPQPISFQNLEIDSTRKEGSGEVAATEWLFGNSTYASSVSSAVLASGNGNVVNDVTNDWQGAQAWNDLNQFNVLP